MADGSRFRDQILEKYDFTPGARQLLRRVPVEIADDTSRQGGGTWNPSTGVINLNDIQDEACLHELAHAWADLSGFYVDRDEHDPNRHTRNFAFRRDVDEASTEPNPVFARVAFLSWEYTYGNPKTGFAGMGEADWERFAGLASGVMGDTRLMPPNLRRWYAGLFGGHPMVPGPDYVPSTAPANWQQGIGLTGTTFVAEGLPGGSVLGAIERFWRKIRGR